MLVGRKNYELFNFHSFIPLNMFNPKFVAFFVASETVLSKSCCISEGDTSPNLSFSAILLEQNLNLTPKCF